MPICSNWQVEPQAVAKGRTGFLVVGTLRDDGGAALHLFLAHLSDGGAPDWFRIYDGLDAGRGRTEGVDVAYLGDPTRPPGGTNPDAFMVLGTYRDSQNTTTGALAFRVNDAGMPLGTARRYLGQGFALPRRLRRTPTQGNLLLGETAAHEPSSPRSRYALGVAIETQIS